MTFKEIGTNIGALVDEKNSAYGNSFAVSGEFLKLLYPDGIKPEQFTDALLLVRMFDKMMRIANKKDAFGESPYGDLAGYSILGISKDAQADAKKEMIDLHRNLSSTGEKPTEGIEAPKFPKINEG